MTASVMNITVHFLMINSCAIEESRGADEKSENEG